jgi:hopene-associated glycosyltransferase HpnB
LIAAGAVVCLIWAYLLLFRGGFWRIGRADPAPHGSAGGPSIAVVIPARDESQTIAHALASLGTQNYGGPLRVIVADDGSTDDTAAIAARYASVIRCAPLPEGWTGKLWALSQGAQQAGAPDYLLFTDADIVHAPDNVASLVARAEARGYDLTSHMATLRCKSLAERALIPAFLFFFFQLYPPAWIANPRRRTAGAAGGCILIRRTALERAGGIAAIRGELIDDCALARAVKRSGGRIWLRESHAVRSIRAYESFDEVGRMISRTAFTQLRYSALLLAGTIVGLAFVYLLPLALTLTGNLWGAAAWLMMSLAYLPAVRFYGRSPLWALLLPAIAVFYMGCTLASAAQYWRGKGGTWKGRSQAARA